MTMKSQASQAMACILAVIGLMTGSVRADHVGNLKGQLSIEQGQAVYRLPIELPKGPNNIQPNWNFVYNSAGGNGLLGIGWGLDLLSVISRCPQTLAQDGQIRGVKDDPDDRFCLDGQRLVVVDGVYGADRSEYRTEIDTYTKVVAFGQHGSGPNAFRVWTKDGHILDYSGLTCELENAEQYIHQWNLVQISDRANNKVNVTYQECTIFPKTLQYGTTTVHLKYGARPDISKPYFEGKLLMNITERLTEIDIENPQPLRKYVFGYRENQSGGSNQSILESVRLCDSHDTCLRPLMFEYDGSDQLVESLPMPEKKLDDFVSGWGAENPRYIYDMNGDGFADIVGFGSGCVMVALNTGKDANFNKSRCWVSGFGLSSGWREANHPRYIADVNGDGLPDVVGFFNDGVHLSINNGRFLEPPSLVLPEYGYTAGVWRTTHHKRFVLDVNGDGRADIVGFHNNGVEVALSKGTTFEASTTWSTEFGYSSSWHVTNNPRFLKDVNGDGLPDIVGMANTGVLVSLNTGTSFSTSNLWLTFFHYNGGWRSEYYPRYVEDINGDGLADIVGFFTDGVYASLSTGRSFTAQQKVLSSFGYNRGAYQVAKHPRMVADLTGDGLPEILAFHDHGLQVSVNEGQGIFDEPKRWVNEFGYITGTWRTTHLREVLDINGDGISDIVGISGTGVHVSLNANRHAKIHKIKDSFDVKQEISYTTMPEALQDGHYEQSDNTNYPVLSPCLPVSIVTGIHHNTGTKTSNTTSLSYGDLKFDLLGRGSLGFRWTKEIFHNHKSITTEIYQEFPLIGKMKRSSHTLNHDSETTVLESEMKYIVREKSSVYEVTSDSGTTISRETYGSLVSEVHNQYIGSNGYGGPLVIISRTVGGDNIFTQTTNNTYKSDPNNWIVGQIMTSQVTHDCPCHSAVTRHTTFEYSADTGFLVAQTIEPNNELSLTTEFEFDDYGNVISKSEVPVRDKGHSRQVRTTYDETGIYMETLSNSEGHTERYDYNSRTGNLRTLIGANGRRTEWTYDELGRKTAERRADGTNTYWSYNWDSTIPDAVYNIQMQSDGSPDKKRVFDALDRVVRESSVGFNLKDITEIISYNPEGLVHKHSLPHYASEDPVWIEFTYDILDRVTKKKTPGPSGTISEQDTRYSGLKSQTSDPLEHISHFEKDALGQLIKVTDNLGGTVHYEYDCIGNIIETTDAGGDITSTEYNVLGHKMAVKDPNMGHWEYEHNAFGELVWQKDANDNVMEQEYDDLGRVVKRREREGVTRWVYDTSLNAIGKLASVHHDDGYTREFSYNDDGREIMTSTEFQEHAFIMQTRYDEYGHVNEQTFPNNISIFNEYTEHGYLSNIEMSKTGLANDKERMWTALNYASSGHLEAEEYGNGLITSYDYDSATHLVGLETYKDGDEMLRQLRFMYDNNDNLISREDLKQDVSETFTYDGLDRLVQSTVNSIDGKYQRRQNWDYFSNGNIRFNDNYGLRPFLYHPTKPQAVVKAGPHTYSYDANGNSIVRNGKTIQWTTFNKPKEFETSGGNIQIKYDPDRNRYLKRSLNGDTTIYLGKNYEINTINNKSSSKVFVYGVAGRLLGIINKNTTTKNTAISYIHTDNLGSVDTVTDEKADIVARMNFDAFGRSRAGNWKESDVAAQDTARGYTGHEHLEELDLIHMNGRVYDPAIGRFLSPDPHVQDPLLTQALNRYSYVLNNPLKHNDPSGFFFKKIGNFFKKFWKPIVGLAISALTAGAATPFAATFVGALGVTGTAASVFTGVLAGAAGGFAGGSYVTGDVKGGLKGAAGGALFGGIGGYFGGTWNIQRVATEATAGGIANELSGGKFKNGFLISGLASSARYLYNTVVEFDVDVKPGAPAAEKTTTQMPHKGKNNLGTQGKPPNPSWLDKEQFLGINWGEEGGLSRVLNSVPGLNAVSGLHDVWQTNFDTVFFSGARTIFNVPSMVPAAAITYTALLNGHGIPALLMDETLKDR